ncbi:quinone oxidoreductase family protein [Saccharomonospora azurea]|uniref:quinone oxidoreductase family protein n=1 Tax=Saccharomonospora azurea TaxID=40988 RepID=UPI00240A92ED|nr:zinc-binding dehydrogenase [Saccharomonospora azurea]
MRAVQITAFGGPEVLRTADVADPKPTEEQVLVDVTLAGINYRDTHYSELTESPGMRLPVIPGMEVVGRTEDGRRVAATVPNGGYAERVAVDATMPVDIPDAVDDFSALALLVQGTTAWLLLHESARIRPGESVLVQAAAGGVGSLAVQLAVLAGAGRVIAAAGTPAKRELARDLGADATVDSTREGFADAVREVTEGSGVDIVLDMSGGEITRQSRAVLAPLGRLICYGMASRTLPPPVGLPELMDSSTTVSGFVLEHATTKPGLLETALRELYDHVTSQRLRVVCGGVYPLAEARAAHEDLCARRTVGKLALDVAR